MGNEWVVRLVGRAYVPATVPLGPHNNSLVQRTNYFHCEIFRFGFSSPSMTPRFRLDGDCMATSSLRVLVVDDFDAFRRVVASILQKQPELQIICEVSDGLEAVQRAEELQPDLILLDIGLPNLNGIEAASRMRLVAPGARIVFLTQNSDTEIVAAALRTGAHGYVLKVDAGRELLTGVAGVLGGNDFISSGVERGDSGETEDT